MFNTYRHNVLPDSKTSSHDSSSDLEKEHTHAVQITPASSALTNATGITLVIRKNTGLTKMLRSCDNLVTLLDGPYPNNHPDHVLKCSRVLLLGGGIGITGLISWANAHPNTKLVWSVNKDHTE